VHRVAGARRRARKKGLPATLTTEQWKAILAAYRHRCAYCGKKESKKRPLTQDHVIPVSRGGGTTPDNIVPACTPCNSRKRDGPPLSLPHKRLLI
jgi:5-methylcytosine-specific restriction endonuclease McrA